MGRANCHTVRPGWSRRSPADIDGQNGQETMPPSKPLAAGASLSRLIVGEITSLERMVQQAVETFGRLDVIVITLA